MTDMLGSILQAIAGPVLIPLVTSGTVWLLNTYTRVIANLPNPLKQLLVVVVGVGLGWVGQHFGLDVTTAEGFASSLVALGIFQIGKNKGAST